MRPGERKLTHLPIFITSNEPSLLRRIAGSSTLFVTEIHHAVFVIPGRELRFSVTSEPGIHSGN